MLTSKILMFEGWGLNPGRILQKHKGILCGFISAPKARGVSKFDENRHRGAKEKTHATTALFRKLKRKSDGKKNDTFSISSCRYGSRYMPDVAFEFDGPSGRKIIAPELYVLHSSGKPWGTTVLESKLHSEWCAGEENGSICDSPTIQCLEVSQEPSRADRKKEREGEYLERAGRKQHFRRVNHGTCRDSLFFETLARQR